MKKALLITHQFLNRNDLNETHSWKLRVFRYTLKKYRELNPDTYIIIVGHGSLPIPNEIVKYADWYYWHHELIPNDISWGHPECVNIGIQHCLEEGIEQIVKTRLDSIVLKPEIIEYCFSKYELKNDRFLVTSFSHDYYALMDLFFAGNVDTLKKLYKYESWKKLWPDMPNKGGTVPMAFNYYNEILNEQIPSKFNLKEWIGALSKKVYLVSAFEIGWLDLRRYNCLVSKSSNELILSEDSMLISNFYWDK